MSENPDAGQQEPEARLQANPELVARIEDAEAHPGRRVSRPERPEPALKVGDAVDAWPCTLDGRPGFVVSPARPDVS